MMLTLLLQLFLSSCRLTPTSSLHSLTTRQSCKDLRLPQIQLLLLLLLNPLHNKLWMLASSAMRCAVDTASRSACSSVSLVCHT